MSPELIESIVKRHGGARMGLIAALEELQAELGYLPEESLELVARVTNRSLVDVYAVATFYKAFSLEPRGEHLVSVCHGTACHVRNSPQVAKEFESQLAIQPGQTTADRKFTLESVNCLGACALGPIVVVDGHYFSEVQSGDVASIIKRADEGLDRVEVERDKRVFPLRVSCSRCNHSLMDPRDLIDGYPSIRVTVAFGRRHGWLRLSSLYGSYHVESEYKIPWDTVVMFFCPHCHTELIGAVSCPECGERMVPLFVRGGGTVQICPRRGCKGHLLDLK